MAFTTPVQVESIIEVDPNALNPDLVPFIDAAHELVVELCVPEGYSAFRLEQIERWLAAHFYAIRDPRKDSEKAGPVSEKNQYKLGLNLLVTTYGQQAAMLDTAGKLAENSKSAEEGKRTSVGLLWGGTKNC